MQKKMLVTAVVAVIAMLSVFMVTESKDSGAETIAVDSNVVEYNVAVTDNREVSIIINENYFKAVDGNYSVQWSYAIGDPFNSNLIYTDFELGQPLENTSFSFTVEQKTTTSEEQATNLTGQYSLHLKAEQSAEVKLTLKFVIDYKVTEGTVNTRDMLTEPLYLVYNLALKGYQEMPDKLGYNVENGSETGYSTTLHVWEGQPISLIPKITNGSSTLTNTDYDWYALNLPKGLAMTNKGVIAGVPTEVTTWGYSTSTVYIQDRYDHMVSFNLNFYVMANSSSGSVTYFLKNGGITAGESTTNMVYEPSIFYTQRDRTASLALLDVNSNKFAVNVLNDDGRRADISPSMESITLKDGDGFDRTCHIYELPTGGTGVYKVEIYTVGSDDTKTLVDSFDLYVLSQVLAVKSAIIVGSDGSS